MTGNVLAAAGNTTSHFGWILGYTIGIVIVLVVVALVVPILLLARSIGNEAPKINDALTEAVHNTAPLAALRTTIEHATIIIGGLQRGRAGQHRRHHAHPAGRRRCGGGPGRRPRTPPVPRPGARKGEVVMTTLVVLTVEI